MSSIGEWKSIVLVAIGAGVVGTFVVLRPIVDDAGPLVS
jgi:hypothetical protein